MYTSVKKQPPMDPNSPMWVIFTDLRAHSRFLFVYLDPYLEGQGDLVSRFIMGIIGVTLWFTCVINHLLRPLTLQVGNCETFPTP